jgi:hypothetical protein
MGRSKNGGLGFGIGSSPQGNISQGNLENKISELSSKGAKPFNTKEFRYTESKSKYDGYLFDLNHSVGGSKAKFLKDVLGYEKGDGQKLHNAISKAIDGKTPNTIKNTNYGIKYNFDVKIEGKDGKFHSANVTVVVQSDNGQTTWRLITLIPGKKDK